jgi:metallo-beta-lactamase family protein
MIEIAFLGAAQTVTGSKHLLRTSRAAVLLDCGLFQGHRSEATKRNRELSLGGAKLDAVVLSHAHIDHSGALPLLFRKGYRGPIYCTPATRDLCVPMLTDAASIQESDARHIRNLIERGEADLEPVEPLYTYHDVNGALGQMLSLPYHRRMTVAPGVDVTFLDAGHVLGSAVVVLDVEDEGEHVRLCFTGDLGRHHLPILRDPQVPDGVQHLITESTYGDRLHESIDEMNDKLAQAIARTVARGGKVIIPSFALERAQEVIFALKQLKSSGRLPDIPVYVDSPLTVKLTEVFKLHPECYDEQAAELLRGNDSPFDFAGLRYVSEVADSMAIDAAPGPAIVISASGMCEAGRVLHHLRRTVEDAKNTIMIVGFQAQHTLGRRIVERRPMVRIFGVMRPLAAEVVVFNGFSAHADRDGLVSFASEVAARGQLRSIMLVHGEPAPQSALVNALQARNLCSEVRAPAMGERVRYR